MNLNRTLSAMPIRLDMPRSGIHAQPRRFLTFNAGKLVPLYRPIEVLPGDTFNIKTGYVLRTSNPPIRPVFDRAWFDVYYFFVPMRLVWQHTKEFFGENNTSYWVQDVKYQIPQLISPSDGFLKDSVADYLYGCYPGVDYGSFSALEARGYTLIYNQWFRDQNYQPVAVCPTGDEDTPGANDPDGDPVTDAHAGGPLLSVNKYHDYFTSALPSPQKAAQGVSISGDQIIPVLSYSQLLASRAEAQNPVVYNNLYAPAQQSGMLRETDAHGLVGYQTRGNGTAFVSDTMNLPLERDDGNAKLGGPMNLGISTTSLANVNQLRFAFQLQKFYERQALGGTRFREQLYSMYGATIPDATSQVPEYLGGSHQQIGVQQVLQTSQTQATPQGNTAAYSYTANGGRAFIKSFCEPGWIFTLGCVRTDHTYQQGLNRQFQRKDLTDFYNPLFANLGAQPIRANELYAEADPEKVIGYQEAWAEYRYLPNDVAGEMRSGVEGSQDVWHYADYYTREPFINGDFMKETAANIDRTLSVQSSAADQFILNIAFDVDMYRVMPLYSVPGFIDHH